jgi:hypothetical protein
MSVSQMRAEDRLAGARIPLEDQDHIHLGGS